MREGQLQYLLKLRANLCGEEDETGPGSDSDSTQKLDDHSKFAERNDSISCDLGLRYPLLQSIFSGHKRTLQVSAYNITYLT